MIDARRLIGGGMVDQPASFSVPTVRNFHCHSQRVDQSCSVQRAEPTQELI
jgi:hypothetical protein